MIQIGSGVLGAVAATLAFGAVHLEVAAGNDLLGPRGLVSPQGSFQDATQSAPEAAAFDVNRAAKGDRASVPAFAASQGVTLSFGLANVPATSIVMRMAVKEPLPSQISQPAADQSQAKSVVSRGARMVACEPSVSVLAPVARQLEPSRCVT